jgi:hypothetical protein
MSGGGDHDIIRLQLETQLATLNPLPDVAWENIGYSPTIGTPFLRTKFAPRITQASALGPGSTTYYTGIYMIDVFQPEKIGPQTADALAKKILELFKWGTILNPGTQQVTIKSTTRSTAQEPHPWYMIPVAVNWYAYI